MAKSKLIKFNVKNVKYAMPTTTGYESPQDLAYADAISLESDYDELTIYGDGQPIAVISDDKGKTGTLTLIALNKAYEIACGRAMEIDGGLADVQTLKSVPHALYFEVEGYDNGQIKTYKVWLFGVISGKPSESYNQTTDNPNVNNYELSLRILGENLKNSSGTADYVDDNGNTIKVYKLQSAPEDNGYTTFGNTVPALKALLP